MPHHDEEEQVPCGICGEPNGYPGTERCDNCWEVESRLTHLMAHSEKACAWLEEWLRTTPAVKAKVQRAQDAWAAAKASGDTNATIAAYLEYKKLMNWYVDPHWS